MATKRNTTQRLHYLASRPIGTSHPSPWHDEILDAAIEVVQSNFASIQIFHPERGANGELRLVGHRGFNAETARRWKWVRPASPTVCGEALRTLQQVAVTDVHKSRLIAGSGELDVFRHAGIRAVQSTPLVSRAGALLGMLSSHWRKPHKFTAIELRACNVLARLAADRIEQSRAEEALRKDQKLLASIYATGHDAILYLAVEPESQFRFVTVNPAFLRLTGLSWESVVGKTVNQVIPEPSLTMVLRRYRRAVEEKAIVSWEETSEYPSGRLTGEVSIAPVFDDRGNCTHLLGSVHDITAYKLTESRLFDQRERLEALMRSLPVGVAFSSDPACEHVTGNQALLDYFGAGPLDNVSPRAADPKAFGRGIVFLREDGRPVHESELPLQRAAREGRIIPATELQIRLPDGRTRFAEVRAAPIRSNAGETVGSLAVTVDIAARKQAAEEQERSRLKDEFLAVLGHELRNPLAAISAAVQLQSGDLTNAQRASSLAMIQRQIAILRRLVDDLLDVSRITHGQITLQKETIDLGHLLQFAAEIARPALTERAQEIIPGLPPESVLFVADPVRIKQIAANLLDNASKYTDREGR
ncbi:MAG TPA: PAS domain S-box protein, partial [Bryobacteraceae bacterium]|nr:PAS domain S-box protein [Bryobacteraceae bacterium]